MTTLDDYMKKLRSEGKACFTKEEALKDLGISNVNLNARIQRAKNKGALISPSRNFYVIVVPEDLSQGAPHPADLTIMLMRHLKINYYCCLLSAAQQYGAAHQRPMIFQVMVSKRMKKLRFGSVGINFIYKKSLEGLPTLEIAKREGYLKVSSPELTAMDLILYTCKSAGLGNVATVLYELIDSISGDKLIELAKHTSGKGWVQRLGYILEQLDSDDEKKAKHKARVIAKLAKYLDEQDISYLRLTSEIGVKGCSRNSKWKIIENTTIESDL
ncbi:MAG: type IV toxin-antitoxin system AbiEi family antitoxin [Candidatus Caenarcaniphilales bacterium]|jgi:predicted transcriptional regulator of viral defense system|nr:type IV toxin-antitoxin system AbiEi family antitoxin [Candidatus Caenarcaniphilales bacterium]